MPKRQLFVGDVVVRESYSKNSSYGVPIGTVGEVQRVHGYDSTSIKYDVTWPQTAQGCRISSGYLADELFLIIPLVPDDQDGPEE